MRSIGVLGIVLTALTFGCAADTGSGGVAGGNSIGGGGSSSAGTGGGGGNGTGGWPSTTGGASAGGSSGSGSSSGAGGLALGGGGTAGGAGTGTGTGNEIDCDGVDNDQNGVIDDVDKGKDGVCDCLRIATLGIKGKYGSGDVFASWLNTRSDFGADALGSQDLTPALLATYDVVIAQDVRAAGAGFFAGGYSSTAVSALEAWVKAGGGFMTLIGYGDSDEATNVNKLLAPFGMNYGSADALSTSGGTIPVTNWIGHPATTGVTQIGVGKGKAVQGIGTMLASEAGQQMLQISTPGNGRVLMWGDEWITYDTEWTAHPEYQVELFWLNVIKWLSPANICQVPIPTGIG